MRAFVKKHQVFHKKAFTLGLGIVLAVILVCGISFLYEDKETTALGGLHENAERIGLSVDQIEIDLPDVENEYVLLFVNDMHILHADDHVSQENAETAQIRQDVMFRTDTGMASADAWLSLSSVLDDFSADGLIFGGDMMDFISPSNMQTLCEGLSNITTPYIYLRADHDQGTWYSGGSIDTDGAIAYHEEISAYEDMFVVEYPEFYVLGWNNSTSQLTDAGLEAARSIWNEHKPILLATHVPIASIVDDGLAQAAAEVDPQGRVKLWGTDCLYQPDENTAAFLDMLYEEQSPVKAIFSGHLHFKYEVQLTEQTMEYVFAPAFEGKIARIVVK